MTASKLILFALIVTIVSYGPEVFTATSYQFPWQSEADYEVKKAFSEQAKKGLLLHLNRKYRARFSSEDIDSLKLSQWGEVKSQEKPGTAKGYAIYRGVVFAEGENHGKHGKRYVSKLLTFEHNLYKDIYRKTGGLTSVHFLKDEAYKAAHARLKRKADKTLDRPVRVIP